MSIDFFSYLNLEKSPQPDTITAAFEWLSTVLRDAHDSEDWGSALEEYMVAVRRWIATGDLDGINAAGALFVGHSLLAGYQALGREGGLRSLSFVSQLSMSESQWAAALKVMESDGLRYKDEDLDVLRVDRFPSTLLNSLFKRGERHILREIFRGARLAIDVAARRAMSDAGDFDSWTADLAVLAAYLTMRRWLPLMIEAESDSASRQAGRIELYKAEEGGVAGGCFIPPPQDENPVLIELFPRDEIDALHRKEAYAAECFAHFYSSVVSGYISPESQKKVPDEYARRASKNRLDARQWLALGKSRFEIAPYVLK